MSVMEASRRGRKQGNLGEINPEALLEPCRLLLLEGSLNTSKKAMNTLDISCKAPPDPKALSASPFWWPWLLGQKPQYNQENMILHRFFQRGAKPVFLGVQCAEFI